MLLRILREDRCGLLETHLSHQNKEMTKTPLRQKQVTINLVQNEDKAAPCPLLLLKFSPLLLFFDFLCYQQSCALLCSSWVKSYHTGFSVSLFCGSFFLETLFSARLNSVVVSAALMSFCRSWAFFSRSFFLVSIFLSSWTRYSSSATCREKRRNAVFHI